MSLFGRKKTMPESKNAEIEIEIINNSKRFGDESKIILEAAQDLLNQGLFDVDDIKSAICIVANMRGLFLKEKKR